MQISSQHLNTAPGWPYGASPAAVTFGVVSGGSVRDATSYDSWMTATPFESSTAWERWLASTTSIRGYWDRTSNLRQRVLSYRAERPRDPSLTQAVNDSLRFIDLIPATVELPEVALADDGEINFFWRRDGLLIDIGFIGDGMMHYYVSDEGRGMDSDASIQFSGRSLPGDIKMAMPKFGAYSYEPYGRVY